MITEDYVSYEVAKLLKEKGFDSPCSGRYSVRSKEFHLDCTKMCNNGGLFECSAPTHQMAMKWLREEYEIFIEISALKRYCWVCTIYKPFEEKIAEVWNDGTYVSYEEAVETALKYCLENLI